MRVRIWIVSIALFMVPSGFAIGADLLYVTLGDSSVVTYDVSLGSASAIAGSVRTFVNSVNNTQGTVFDSSGNFYAASYVNNTISKFDPVGGFLETIGSPANIDLPRGLVMDSAGNIYVANSGNSTISKFDSSGAYQPAGSITTNLNQPRGLAIDSSGNLYAAISGNTISKFDSLGTYLGNVGSSSNLAYPYGLAIDSSGYLYASNYIDNTVSKFDSNGVFQGKIGNDSNLDAPIGLAFDSSGNLYVANFNDSTISRYNSGGTFEFSWSTGFWRPSFITASTVVPEPTTYVMSLIGVIALAFMSRRRRKTYAMSCQADGG